MTCHDGPQAFHSARSSAFRLMQDFVRFAEVACGCKATSNRAQLRRAVFHTTQSMDWKDLLQQLDNEPSEIEAIARPRG